MTTKNTKATRKKRKSERDSEVIDIEKIVLKFKKSGDEKIRNEILSSDACKRIVEAATAPFLSSGLYDDLKQDAYIGVIRAIEHYRKGGNFYACASIYAKNEIYSRYHKYVCPVAISARAVRKNKLIAEFISDFYNKTGNPPSISTIAEGLKMKESRVNAFFNINKSINLEDLILELEQEEPADKDISESLAVLKNKLGKLNALEKRIIEESFGFSGKKRTLEKVAKDLGKTKQRVSQIRIRALKKLKTILRK